MCTQYFCSDPMNSVCRVLDIARRLDLRFAMLHIEQTAGEKFVLSFKLDNSCTLSSQNFSKQIERIQDLEKESSNV